jgi:Trk K+ transport system NAD-binding subunit
MCGSAFIRDDQLVLVHGSTTLHAGDEILALTDPDLASIFAARSDTGESDSPPG